MTPNELRLLFELAKNKGCKFITLTYTSTEGETAKHTIAFGSNYKNALERDLKYLKRLRDRFGRMTLTQDGLLLFQAVTELVESTEKSLAKYDGDELSKSAKEKDVYNTIFPGVKQHKETGAYYLWGQAVRKTVIKPASTTKNAPNSKPLTIAKDRIRRKLRTNRYRQFRLDSVAKSAVNGDTLVIE